MFIVALFIITNHWIQLFKIFIYLLLTVLGLHCCKRRAGTTLQWQRGAHCSAFFHCVSWAPGVRPQQSQRMGLAAPWHVESSQTRDQTSVPCIGRQILNHWTTRKVPKPLHFNTKIPLFSKRHTLFTQLRKPISDLHVQHALSHLRASTRASM